jgi:hypothetical protein
MVFANFDQTTNESGYETTTLTGDHALHAGHVGPA